MTANLPVQRVVDTLTSAGYKRQSLPIKVSSIPFEFSAALLGSQKSQDLVVVVDTLSGENPRRVQQKVEAMSRALDLAQSRRPLTVVVVGPPLSSFVHEAMARVARVLQVGVVTGPDQATIVEDALAVLLPLVLPDNGVQSSDAFGELRAELGARSSASTERLIHAAAEGKEQVRDALATLLATPLKGVEP